MNVEQIQQIPLDTIRPSEGNRRVGGFDPAKLEQLAESIRAVGVQQPAVVRRNGSEGGYELVAGERRWRAARLAGLEVLPCVVRELDDVQVLKIQTIENLQREDIHPLDEADGYARLIQKAGYDVEHLAQEVGRSASYVYQRLKLRDLVEPARKLLVDGVIQAGHGILLARLQPPEQRELVDWLKHGGSRWGEEQVSVRALDEHIHRTILLDLSKAPFKRDDAQLVPEAGPCITCPKRTGFQPALFADVSNKRDYCTDPGCFQGKLSALVNRRRQELELDGVAIIPHLKVSTSWGRSYVDEQRLEKEGVKKAGDWEECKKSEEGAVRCLVVDGADRGRLTWGRERRKVRGQRVEPTAEEKKAREKENRERRIRTAERRALWDALMGRLAGEVLQRPDLPEDLWRMLAFHVWERTWDNYRALFCRTVGWEKPARKKGEYGTGWHELGNQKIEAMTTHELRHFLISSAVIADMELQYGREDDKLPLLHRLAGILQLDAGAVLAEAKARELGKIAAKGKPGKGSAK